MYGIYSDIFFTFIMLNTPASLSLLTHLPIHFTSEASSLPPNFP